MAELIEDYALIGDTQSAGLVSRRGRVDWLCLPRFDSGACFAALLGEERNGTWIVEPATPVRAIRRAYRRGTLIVETQFETARGTISVTDFMPVRGREPDLVRLVRGVSGNVPVRMSMIPRFDYGSVKPWVQLTEDGAVAFGGPDGLALTAALDLRIVDHAVEAEFVVDAGAVVPLVLAWFPSADPVPPRRDALLALDETERWWRDWTARGTYTGEWKELVDRSLITLKALTYRPTGGIVAAPTTSLPEALGGVRNWDYRFCWVRDATFTLYALLNVGHTEEARAWRDWLLRAVAGDPAEFQLMYGVAGERRLPELELPWLSGYEGSRPVRIGNAAAAQLQLDVYGELMDAMHTARKSGIEPDATAWELQVALLEYLESAWRQPDSGIWEMRGPKRHFTHSKVMAWVAFDRGVKASTRFGLDGPVDRWRRVAQEIHADVCLHGYDAGVGAFVQTYGSTRLDASLLMIPLVGFLPPDDERVRQTVEAIERDLSVDGLVLRYRTEEAAEVDALPPGEAPFLACSFWLVDALALLGRRGDAVALFERLVGLANDVGLLAEEYDPVRKRQLGNFPQALTHLALVNSATTLGPAPSAAERRGREEERESRVAHRAAKRA